jgi:hypothetical protein
MEGSESPTLNHGGGGGMVNAWRLPDIHGGVVVETCHSGATELSRLEHQIQTRSVTISANTFQILEPGPSIRREALSRDRPVPRAGLG